MNNYLLFLLIIFNCLVYSISDGQSFTEQVDGKSVTTKNTYFSASINKKESSTTDYIGFYQKYISGIRGQECPMYPSCSNYGLKTFSETNFVSAFVMTSDRLLRCGHDHNNYALTLRSNGFRLLDYPAYDNPPTELYYQRNSYHFAYSDTTRDESSFVFIKKLINNQYYQEALLEIMRLEFQTNSFNIDLFINKIICLKALGEYEKALFEYETKCPTAYKLDTELVYQIALIQFKLQNYQEALQKNTLALASSNDQFSKAKIILLNGLLYANQHEWQKAKLSYQSLAMFDSHKQVSAANLLLSEKAMQLKDKSPFLAGMFSIIPGAGYAYTGHKQTALSAFLVNGLLTYATYSSIHKKNYGMALLTGVFNISFYVGNIYGASKSAKRFNEQQRKSIINKLAFNSNF